MFVWSKNFAVLERVNWAVSLKGDLVKKSSKYFEGVGLMNIWGKRMASIEE